MLSVSGPLNVLKHACMAIVVERGRRTQYNVERDHCGFFFKISLSLECLKLVELLFRSFCSQYNYHQTSTFVRH